MADKPMALRSYDATGADRSKLASTVARQIVDDVIAAGWPVGETIGSESELLERYGVSRAVLREAIRLVEHQQVARMRPGLGRGLVITEPNIDSIIDAVAFYLDRVDVGVDQVFGARIVLEEFTMTLAPTRLDESDIEGLRHKVAEEQAGVIDTRRELHRLLADTTQNRVLSLFVEILTKVSHLYRVDRLQVTTREISGIQEIHGNIVSAVVAGDVGSARWYMRRHLEAEAAFFRDSTRKTPNLMESNATREGSKLAEEIARAIFQRVLDGDLRPGDLISSESELVEEYGASRAVVRQAVRLLEHHQIAKMRRGPGGGLFVLAPSPNAVADIVALYLEHQGVTVRELFEVRLCVELAVVDLAIERLTPESTAELVEALQLETSAPPGDFSVAAHDLHIVLASLSGNRVLELLVSVLVRLSHMHEIAVLGDQRRRKMADEADRTHNAIVESLMGSDLGLTRNRMQKHLMALQAYFA